MTGSCAVVVLPVVPFITVAPFTVSAVVELLRLSPFNGPVENLSVDGAVLLMLCASRTLPPLVVNESGTMRLAADTDDTDSEEAADDSDDDDDEDGGDVELRFNAGLPRVGEDMDRTGEIVV
uniref:Putative secreted protein n=1 Tax=Anopheles darlingi TaxID=43151 RepID=A0A2M4DJA4_ANODA